MIQQSVKKCGYWFLIALTVIGGSCSDEQIVPELVNASQDIDAIDIFEDPAFNTSRAASSDSRVQASTMKVKKVTVYLNRDEYAEGKFFMKIVKTSDGSLVTQTGTFDVTRLMVHSATRRRYTLLNFNMDRNFDLGVEYKIEMHCKDCSDDDRKKVNWWYSDDSYKEGIMYSLGQRRQRGRDFAFKVEALTPEGLSYVCAFSDDREDIYHFNYSEGIVGQTFKVGEVINFADHDLQMAVQFALGIAYDQPVVTSAVLNLEGLKADYIYISDLGGIEHLKNLTWLKLQINSIVNIDALKGLTALTELNLYHNAIESCQPLEGLTNLTSLDLSDNKIRNVQPLKKLRKLKYLNLKDNPVSVNDIRDLEATLGIEVVF